MATWKFELCTLNGGRIGEITQMTERTISIPLSRLPTANFRVRLDNPLAGDILASDRLVKAYRDGALRYNGLITGIEEAAEGESQTISVSTVSPAWRLQHRMTGKSVTSPHPGIAYGTAGTPIDIGAICTAAINAANGDGGTLTTGVQIGTVQASATTSVGPVWFKPVMETITELLHSAAAPEVEWKPIEPTGAWPNTAVVQFNAYYPRAGQDRPAAIFEFGHGKRNVASYQRQISYDGILTRAHIMPESFPTTTGSVTKADDLTAQATRGVYEGTVDTDVVYPALRQSLANAHVSIRKNPRQVLLFRPIKNADIQPFVDYFLGDTVTARAVINNIVRFAASFRVYGMTFVIDDAGNEDVELELMLPTL